MNKALIILIIMSAFQTTVANTPKDMLILQEIQKNIAKDFDLEAETKIIEIIPDNKKEDKVDKKKKSPPVIPQKKLSKGEQKVQELLKKNRERIKKMKKSRANKDDSKDKDWMKSKLKQVDNWREEKLNAIESWEKEKKAILDKWYQEKLQYQKRIPTYKKNLVSLESIAAAEQKSLPKKEIKHSTKKVNVSLFNDYKIINNAFSFDVKDQGRRPTCAAFAGVRALEIVLAQKNINESLSEQYFFWSSKPNCTVSPCKKSGSWVITGYRNSQMKNEPNIPLEIDCKTSKKSSPSNVTQIPLNIGCQKGYAKVENYQQVSTLDEIVNELKNDHPVVGGFTLSPNFYRNNGYVFMSDKQRGSKLDSHASGHAILLVGYMKLPKKLHKTEGSFCLIAANSWGIGWGKGGHACLSEKWINKYRYQIPFVSLREASAI